MTPARKAVMPDAAVIVASGGSGARFALDSRRGDAKQFHILGGKPVLAHTLAALERHPRIALIVLILPESFLRKGNAFSDSQWSPGHVTEHYPKVKVVAAGGDDRQGSVANGLDALARLGWTGPVLVHDGVRPCTPAALIDRVIDGVLSSGNAVPAIPITDTVKKADDSGVVVETLDRQNLWQIQTPQGFRLDDLVEAHREGRRRGLTATDDAALLEALGRRVHLVRGDAANIKLTYPDDLPLLEAILQKQTEGESRLMYRTGFGYDVHPLSEGTALILGGVEIPWPKGLSSYSDGDVLLHAVMDALLGAAGLGDIGVHFPDTDPAYQNCSSLALLSQAGKKVCEAGYAIANLDCTLVAQRPRIAPYTKAMRENICHALDIADSLICVKATTTEHLGFTGREEGMACYAVCSLHSLRLRS